MVLDCRLKHEKVKYYCHLVVKGYSHLCLHIHPFLFNCRNKKYGGGHSIRYRDQRLILGTLTYALFTTNSSIYIETN